MQADDSPLSDTPLNLSQEMKTDDSPLSDTPLNLSQEMQANDSPLSQSSPLDLSQEKPANDSPLSQSSPLDLSQETVHAVGGSGSREMPSGILFTLPSGYQTRIEAATTLSQVISGYNQPSSTTQSSLPIQAQDNTQIVQPVQSVSQVGDGQQSVSEEHQRQFQGRGIEDCQSYIDQVKRKSENEPGLYSNFIGILKECKSESIDTQTAITRVCNLFRAHPELIEGWRTFVPPGFRFGVQPIEQVQVNIPDTIMAGGQGPTSSNIQPTGPPSTTAQPMPRTNRGGRDASSTEEPTPADAISYLKKVDYYFGYNSKVYIDFLQVLEEYKAGSIDFQSVIQHVFNSFRGHPELIEGFNIFMPSGYRAEVQPNGQVHVTIPETNVAGGQGPTPSTIHPKGPPSTTVHSEPQNNPTERDASPHVSSAATSSTKNSTGPTIITVHPATQSNITRRDNSYHTSLVTEIVKIIDAVFTLSLMKNKSGNTKQTYDDYGNIVREFESGRIDMPGVLQRLSILFREHPEFIEEINALLPAEYRIEVQSNEQPPPSS